MNMAQSHTVEGPIAGADDKTISFESGKFAGQAGGAVTVRLDDTVVLVTATASKGVRDGIDFFPLTVDIEERMYAAGRIPGSFFRREGKASDNAVLTCRLIDRPIRPAFPDDFRNEVHVVGTVLGTDMNTPYDVLAINGASAALVVSDIPFAGPIGAVRIGWSTDGEWIPFPTYEEAEGCTFELVVAGRETSDGSDIAIMMVEAGGTEGANDRYVDGAPKVTEAVLASGLDAAKAWIRQSIELQLELLEKLGGAKPTMSYPAQID
jgi:polyribonucleotide nucleotidyltransferase